MSALAEVAAAAWFVLPAGAASTAPVLVRRVPLLATPVDRGARLWGEPLFGANKTWRGVVAATLTGWLAFALQQQMLRAGWVGGLTPVVPASAPAWWGALIGGGAILGDLVKSFFKRRAGVAAGRSWFPFDQIDYAVGAIAGLAPWWFVGWRPAAVIVAVALVMHVGFVVLGRALGVRERWI